MDLNDIRPGTYLLTAKLWDEITSRPGQPFDFTRHRRGDIVDLNIEDARRLVVAEAVIPYDPNAPSHVVNADGSISEVIPEDPAATGMVLTQEHLEVLSQQLGIPADATSEDIVLAVQQLQQDVAAANQANDRPKSDRIGDILEWVGSDKSRAATALEGERTVKADKARPNLVFKLEEIITAPPAGGSQ